MKKAIGKLNHGHALQIIKNLDFYRHRQERLDAAKTVILDLLKS